MNKEPNYTVFMTKGTHVVTNDAASKILESIRNGETDVTIHLDPLGDGSRPVLMTLVVSHVVSMMRHNEQPIEEYANIRFLRR